MRSEAARVLAQRKARPLRDLVRTLAEVAAMRREDRVLVPWVHFALLRQLEGKIKSAALDSTFVHGLNHVIHIVEAGTSAGAAESGHAPRVLP